MIRFHINDPGQVADAVAEMIRTAGIAGRDYVFTMGPMDDKELARDLEVFVDGPDEVEASEVLGQRLIAAGVAFDAVP